jgi:hypothetical protein
MTEPSLNILKFEGNLSARYNAWLSHDSKSFKYEVVLLFAQRKKTFVANRKDIIARYLLEMERISGRLPEPEPPTLGEALLVLFCPKNRTRHMIGDLEELFHEDLKTKDRKRAKLLYWSAVLRSIGPLLWMKVRKAGFIALVLEIGRRWSGTS